MRIVVNTIVDVPDHLYPFWVDAMNASTNYVDGDSLLVKRVYHRDISLTLAGGGASKMQTTYKIENK